MKSVLPRKSPKRTFTCCQEGLKNEFEVNVTCRAMGTTDWRWPIILFPPVPHAEKITGVY